MTKDLTRGTPWKLILQFALPIMAGNLLQQLYNTADTIIVGNFNGQQALSAVGACASLTVLFTALAIGFSIGAGVLISQYFGASRERELRQYAATAIVLMLAMGLFMSLAGVVSARFLLERVLGTPEALLPMTLLYFRIYAAGLVFQFGYNIAAALLRALGDSKATLYFLLVSSILNVVLDLAFVAGLGLGVAGAALATVVSQLGSGLLCVGYLKKHFPILRMEKDDWKLRRPEVMRLLGMGVPVGLQFSITAIGSVMLQSAVNSLGAVCVSGVAVAGKIYMLLACPFDALAMAATNFTGQNLGAGKYDRIKQGTYACMFIGILYCVLFVLIAQFGTRYLALLFMNADEAASVMSYTQQLSVAYAYATPLLLGVNVLRLSIQGMGYSRLSLISGLLEMLARTAVSLWAVPAFGFDAACLASPLAWLLADCFLIPAFYGCLNARRRQAARVRKELPEE